jgi:hypothetical protein
MKPFRLPRWRFMNCCGHSWGHRPAPIGPTAEDATESPSRRDFIRSAAAGVAGLAAVGAGAATANAQVRVFPPPPPAVSPVQGLIDFHVHAAPDVFGRSIDDDEAATLYRGNKLEAILLKNHVALTADRAWLVQKHVPGIKAFGGVVLNGAAGGINPEAVQWMWRMQGGLGRVVWFPTFDADNHVKHFKDAPEGIKIVGADGRVLPAVMDVLKVCAQQKLVVCTGHASPAQALALIQAARDAGCDRLVVTHAQFEVVNMSMEDMKKAAAMGARMEICAMGPLMGPQAHLGWMRHWRQVTTKESAERIKAVGAQHFVLSTDLGQTGNPSPPDGFKMLVSGLMAEGVTKEQITMMGRETPGKLLMG